MKRLNCLGFAEGLKGTLLALSLIGALALPVATRLVATSSPRHLPHTRLHPDELKRRTTAICIALGELRPIVGEPEYVVEEFKPECRKGKRCLWFVTCESGPHEYSFIYNDLTGNLQSLYSDAPRSHGAPRLAPPSIADQNAALEGSIRRLNDLKLTPPGTQIALMERPTLNRLSGSWRILWKVKSSPKSAPSEVRMLLDSRDHVPLTVVNFAELERPVSD